MKTDENSDANNADGTPPSEDEALRAALQRRRAIAIQMFHFIEEYPWLQETPDIWLLRIMDEIRPAAQNLLDFDKYRIALLKTGAALFAAIEMGDKLFKDNHGVVPLPESIFGKDE